MSQHQALLLVNLGTPDSPSVPDVRRYLEQFLMDPYVINGPQWFRTLLVKGIILPSRPQKSAEAYQSIWTQRGSPLLALSKNFAQGLAERLKVRESKFAHVELAMRYGNPSIKSALEKIANAGISDVLVWPLYPQFADSSTTTVLSEVQNQAARLKLTWSHIPAFYNDPRFLEALGIIIDRELIEHQPDYVLFSFHGLPKRHLRRVSAAPCVSGLPSCCDRITNDNKNCYRAQSMETARKLAGSLNLRVDQWSVSFQSRLGSGWIQPFTDHVIPQLARNKVRHLAIACPAFVTDCLETLEEIGIRARELFLEHGGERLTLIPCLNADPVWLDRAADIVDSWPK